MHKAESRLEELHRCARLNATSRLPLDVTIFQRPINLDQ